jgi:phosphatidylserine synthase
MNIKELFSIFSSVEFPHMLTLIHLVLGMVSVMFAVSGDFLLASVCMIVAVVFDLLDDKVAKIMKKMTSFGYALERIAGLVSFGVAPVVLAYQTTPDTGSGWIFAVIIYIVFLCAAALQIARMHVSEKEHHYEGLPVILNGLVIPLFYFVGLTKWYPLIFILFAIGMVSSFRIRKVF